LRGFESLADARYVSLGTFRKDGTRVDTPMWFVLRDDRMVIRTGAASAKIKRIRNNERVTIAPCTPSGKVTGPMVEARAKVLPESEVAWVEGQIKARYGLMKALVDAFNGLRGVGPHAGIEVTPR
jgi:hypothetical protein